MLAHRLLDGPLGIGRKPDRGEIGRARGNASLRDDVKVLSDVAILSMCQECRNSDRNSIQMSSFKHLSDHSSPRLTRFVGSARFYPVTRPMTVTKAQINGILYLPHSSPRLYNRMLSTAKSMIESPHYDRYTGEPVVVSAL